MNFSELNLHPTVASALAKRGYETSTPVQAAVLHPDAAGRDLLVSSQTGSGKTIAFGAALAENLLAPEAARAAGSRSNPLALVIVPTRELAVQVREELGWLLRDTKLRLASFTGGTPVSGDLRTLQKGLDIVIGTPGRLVDLLRRQRLELSEVRVVVLDEADEMLDLGFREDLTTILQEAPESRRTLLLSATLPPEIQALAKRFQRDALRIDPRKAGGQAPGSGHGDITYVAHLIAGADRLAVVVNILRAAGNGRAIVFCTTREGVSRLHTALTARGFAATAISGDRAQAERDRALEQVRKGDARVLVATNVAARGLHLPDVDLIIHADLPLNAESLTHRSGRTGRAGRKGTAVVLASLTERRKAERLMMEAKVPVVWTAPPSPESITAAARARLEEELLQAAGAEGTEGRDDGPPEDPAAEEMVKRLEQVLPARELARRLLLRELVHLPVGERIHPVAVPGPERRDRFAPARAPSQEAGERQGERDGRRPGRGDFAREGMMFRVNIGARDNADPRWLLPLICRRGGVGSRDVGAIRVGPQETVFEISGDVANDFALSATERDPRAPHVVIEPMRPLHGTRAPDRAPAGGGPRDHARPRPHAQAGAPASAKPPASAKAPPAEKPATVEKAAAPEKGRTAEKTPTNGDAPPGAKASSTAKVSVPPKASAPGAAPAGATATQRAEGASNDKHVKHEKHEQAKKRPARAEESPNAHQRAEKREKTGTPTATRPAAAPSEAPPRKPPAAAPPPAPVVQAQPVSIFQTRTPAAATPFVASARSHQDAPGGERGGRPGAGGPLIEMKRAPRVGGMEGRTGHRSAASPDAPSTAPAKAPKAFTVAGPRAGEDPGSAGAALGPRRDSPQHRPSGPRTDGMNPPRRSFNARAAGSGDGFEAPDRSPNSDRPGFGPRGGKPFRGGTGPSRGPAPPHASGAGRPGSGSFRPKDGPGRPPAGGSRPPFWKDGARKRPGAGPSPARGAQGGEGAAGKPRR